MIVTGMLATPVTVTIEDGVVLELPLEDADGKYIVVAGMLATLVTVTIEDGLVLELPLEEEADGK